MEHIGCSSVAESLSFARAHHPAFYIIFSFALPSNFFFFSPIKNSHTHTRARARVAEWRSVNGNVNGGKGDVFATSPWRAPGTAKVYGSGCGAAGGGPTM